MSRFPERQHCGPEAVPSREDFTLNHELLRVAFTNSPAIHSIVRFDDAVILEVNDTFTQTLGYAREEVIGKTPLELNFWVNPERLNDYRQQLKSAGYVRDFEVEVRTKGGRIRTVLLSSQVVEVDGTRYSLSAGVDISERKRSEAILRATYRISEAAHAAEDLDSLYAQVHEIVQELMPAKNFYIALYDPASQLISFPYFVDEQSERPQPFPLNTGLTGYVLRTGKALLLDGVLNQQKTYVGDKVSFAGHPDLAYIEVGQPAATWLGVPLGIGGKPFGVMAVQDYEDERAYAQEERQILAFVATQTALAIDRKRAQRALQDDISERKKAETELRQSEARLRESEARFSTAFNACPVLMTMATLEDGRFVEVNDAFIDAFGLERAKIIGRNSLELNIWVKESERTKFFERLKQERSLRNHEVEAHDRHGVVHQMQVSADIIEINRKPHLLTFALDITERKRAEAELQKALETERELSQLRSDFVSLVSHEFRTPLEIIMSSADNLDRYHDRLPASRREQLLRTINRSVRRMSGMMEEVLVLGRLETDHMVFKPALFELKAFCVRVCDEIEAATDKRCPIQLQTVEAADQAFGDESVLRHVFTNLLSNAVKYSQPAQAIEFLVHREGINAVCRIVDHGCGIPESDQKRLFQAFHRGSNVRQVPGTGLGLLIVQRCVALHHGEIQFESVEGKGTTFTIRLPLFREREWP